MKVLGWILFFTGLVAGRAAYIAVTNVGANGELALSIVLCLVPIGIWALGLYLIIKKRNHKEVKNV